MFALLIAIGALLLALAVAAAIDPRPVPTNSDDDCGSLSGGILLAV